MNDTAQGSRLDLLVIGGGAAGYFAALRAAACRPELSVRILEAGEAPLRKVRISGGGRCNVTHACFEPERLVRGYPRGSKELRGPLTRFQPRDVVRWFSERGVELKAEDDGRMFPITDSSETIIDCLERERKSLGVELRPGEKVIAVERDNETFLVRSRSRDGERVHRANAIALTTGGTRGGYLIAEALGHTIEPPVPSLFTFQVRDERIADLSGVSVADVALLLRVGGRTLEERGPLLVTHWGLSGPAVIRLSAWGARELFDSEYRGSLVVDWIPNLAVDEEIRRARDERPKRNIAGDPLGTLPKRLWQRMVSAAGVEASCTWSQLSRSAAEALAESLRRSVFEISGKGVFKEEFVTCGGVRLSEIDFRRMESKLVPRLFFAGEVLDIDGITGGFNFQSAWTTGWIAGSAVGEPP